MMVYIPLYALYFTTTNHDSFNVDERGCGATESSPFLNIFLTWAKLPKYTTTPQPKVVVGVHLRTLLRQQQMRDSFILPSE